MRHAGFGLLGGLALGIVTTSYASRLIAQNPTVAAHASRDASTSEILAQRITIHLTNVSLTRAIDSVSRVAKIFVQYRLPLLQAYPKPVTLDVTDVPLGVVLEQVLSGTMLRAVPEGPDLTIVALPDAGTDSVPDLGIVDGRVIDSATGRGLSGVTIKVAGTKISVVTQDSGRFMLRNVPVSERTLTAKAFGYRPSVRMVTVSAGQEVAVRFGLVTVPTVLSGVVTTATGTQRKIEVGNDITALNVDSIQQIAPITSVTDLLESRVPGLTVLRSSGTPGDPARLRLRGPKSITGSNDPIVIVDGIRQYAAQSDLRTANIAGSAVSSTAALGGNNNYAAPSPLDQIDPNSIETIEVIKGPSASSLYGSDAANGVIVITTKRGRAGPTHWNGTLAQGLSYLPGDYPVQAIRWAHGPYYSISYPVSAPCNITQAAFCNVFDSVTHLQVVNVPHWSPFGHGNTTNGSMTVSGGTSALTYALTGSAGSDLGYLELPDAMADAFQSFHGYTAPGWAKHPDKYTTWSSNGQLAAQASPTMQLTFQGQLFHGMQQRSSLEQELSRLLRAVDTICGNGFATCGSQTLETANAYERATDEQLTLNSAVSAAWAPRTWLPLTGTVGLNVNTGRDVTFLARDLVPYIPNGSSKDALGRYGTAQKNATTKTITVSTLIPSWRGKLRTALGFNIYNQSTNDLAAEQDSIPLGVTTPSILTHPTTAFATGTSTFGWFFEPRLTLSDRLFLTPGFRLDGGNANGQNASVSGLPKKLTFAALFPKVNFSWVAVDRQEGDVAPVFGILTLLRPRLALGSAGVQPNPGDQLRLLSFRQNPDSSVDGGIVALGNTQLRPERSSEVEGGFEMELWHGRVTTDLTHSRQLRHDAIISVPVAPSVYNTMIAVNIGEIRNVSTEFSGSIRPIETPMVSWTIGGNWSTNNNIVLKLDPQSTPILGNTMVGAGMAAQTKVAAGYPLFGRWAQPIVNYQDDNRDGIIEANEIRYGDTAVYLGRQDPAYTAALTTDLSMFHGRLGIHANMSRQGGYSQLNGSAAGGMLSAANEANASLGTQANYVAATTGKSFYGLVQTVSEWRFDALSLNYTVPFAIAQRFHAHAMSVALQGSNLGLWTNYRGKDPNVNAYPNGNATADLGQLAQPRTWRLQLTLGN